MVTCTEKKYILTQKQDYRTLDYQTKSKQYSSAAVPNLCGLAIWLRARGELGCLGGEPACSLTHASGGPVRTHTQLHCKWSCVCTPAHRLRKLNSCRLFANMPWPDSGRSSEIVPKRYTPPSSMDATSLLIWDRKLISQLPCPLSESLSEVS